jgi:hypothetical protein
MNRCSAKCRQEYVNGRTESEELKPAEHTNWMEATIFLTMWRFNASIHMAFVTDSISHPSNGVNRARGISGLTCRFTLLFAPFPLQRHCLLYFSRLVFTQLAAVFII